MKILRSMCLITAFVLLAVSARAYEHDRIATNAGPLEITFIKHASLMFKFRNKVIYIDPVASMGSYRKLPLADIILVTHQHRDHFDPGLIRRLSGTATKVVMPEICAAHGVEGIIMRNGDKKNIDGLKIEAVPAYNFVHRRPNGKFYHPKGIGNGYVINFGGKRVYVAGDTENTKELKSLKNIDIAFLPMQLPYTMSPEMVADAAFSLAPKILYPYHLGNTNPQRLLDLMKGHENIEVRIRNMP